LNVHNLFMSSNMKTQSYSRRSFLKMMGLGSTLMLKKHSAAFGLNATDALKNKPNIVFILTDDQRYDAMRHGKIRPGRDLNIG